MEESIEDRTLCDSQCFCAYRRVNSPSHPWIPKRSDRKGVVQTASRDEKGVGSKEPGDEVNVRLQLVQT